MKQKSTISDVAKLAGVSKSAVSKYLNNIPYVSDETRKRIEQAIKELDYYPNNFARALVHNSIKLIGLVISNIHIMINTELIKSIEEEANQLGYNIVLVTTNDNEANDERLLEILKDRFQHLDGLILANARENRLNLEALKQSFEHIVMVHRHVPTDFIDYVVVDNYTGGKLAAEYLVRLGHKQIGMIQGQEDIYPTRERARGFIEVLQKYELYNPEYIIEGGKTLEDGYRAAEKIMLSNHKPTAIFAISDVLAFGLLDAAREYGWKIPEEISLIGFDNLFFCKLARVPLTTIDSRIKELGTQAVQLLVQKIEGQIAKETLQQVMLAPSLVSRESCKEISHQ
ncbi:LacI family transcriptional regulator [Paenibacillus sp. WQ 127069]|uniref:LacI family transcriptional regulator n=1 Tax=Paenibacillus baimaensis TaxID=2982185 RepID=A0ABT2ULN9_9BACL|nr:LacI family DNA-binding transcriptional regulator [Paenibacillus sp. WQ 127069]MCU6795570.1 LacI family transcriptional regulator [Paenibacillus sp. WQ 127069]